MAPDSQDSPQGSPSPAAPPAAAPKKRSWLRLFLIIAAAGVVLLALLVFLAPTLLSSFGEGWIEKSFARKYRGRLELDDLDLSWRDRQLVRNARLFDADGRQVAEASIELPPLLDLIRGGGAQIGKVALSFSADLVADDQGASNLESALAERDPSPKEVEEPSSPDDGSMRERLEKLDLEVEVTSPRISWSDRTTRESGKPFLLENFRAQLKVEPGQPVTLTAEGRIHAGEEGALIASATILHPFAPTTAAEPPRMDVEVKVDHFSTALVDNVAGQQGLLLEALGPDFHVNARGQGTVDAGSFEAELGSERGSASIAGTLENGAFHGKGGAALKLSLKPTAELITRLAAGAPPGLVLTRTDPETPIEITVTSLDIPVAQILDAQASAASGAQPAGADFAAKAIGACVLELSAWLGSWSVEDESLRAAGKTLEVRALQASASLRPKDGAANFALELGMRAGAGELADVHASAKCEDVGELLRVADGGGMKNASIQAEVRGLSTDLVDLWAQQGGALERELGTTIDLSFDANASLAASGASAHSSADWKDSARRLATRAQFRLERTSGARPAKNARASGLRKLSADVDLAPSQPLSLVVDGELASESPSPLHVDARVTGPFEAKPEVEASARIEGFPTSVLDGLAGLEGRAVEFVGATLSLRAEAKGTLDAGSVQLDLTAPRASVKLSGELAGGVFKSKGDGLAIACELPADVVHRWAPELETDLGLALGRRAQVDVRSFAIPLQAILDASARGADVTAAALGGTTLDLQVGLDELRLATAALRAKKQTLQLSAIAVRSTLQLAAGAPAFEVRIDSKLGGSASGEVHVAARGRDARELLTFASAHVLSGVDFEAGAKGFPTELAEALSGASDLRARLGDSVDVSVTGHAELAKGAPLVADAKLELASKAAPASITLKAKVDDPFGVAHPRAAGTPPPLEASLQVDGTERIVAFLPPAFAASARELFGPTLTIELANEPTAGAGKSGAGASAVRLDVTGARFKVALAGKIEDSTFRTSADQGLAVSIQPSSALIAELLGPKLPPGAKLEIATEAKPFSLRVVGASVSLDAFAPADGGSPVDALLATMSADVALELPDLVYTHPAGTALVPVELRNVRLDARVAPAAPLTAKLSGDVHGEQVGKIDVAVEVNDAAALVKSTAPGTTGSVVAHGVISGLPTALVDALASQEGLLVDVLGPELTVKVDGRWPGVPGEPVRAELQSKQASVQFSGTFDDGMLQAQDKQGLDAKLPLTPLFSKRIVGSMVPLLVSIGKAAGAPPMGLSMNDFRLPLDGDLSKLNGTLRLDLGEVQYELMPGLTGLIENPGQAPQAKSATLKPIELRIENGVARYDNLVIPLQGKELSFGGSYDLARSQYALTTNVPLALLGRSVEREIEKVRQYLDPNMIVPIEIRGSGSQFSVRPGKEFLDKVVKSAAKGALQKGLFDLLDKDKDKKPSEKKGDKKSEPKKGDG